LYPLFTYRTGPYAPSFIPFGAGNMGLHPVYKNVGILNGMGTKGCSLAPYFASQLAAHILYRAPIEKDADISRHSRILERTSA
ncbi:MAG: hypothetical protein QM594_17260, partial [Niabella sp.]